MEVYLLLMLLKAGDVLGEEMSESRAREGSDQPHSAQKGN